MFTLSTLSLDEIYKSPGGSRESAYGWGRRREWFVVQIAQPAELRGGCQWGPLWWGCPLGQDPYSSLRGDWTSLGIHTPSWWGPASRPGSDRQVLTASDPTSLSSALSWSRCRKRDGRPPPSAVVGPVVLCGPWCQLQICSTHTQFSVLTLNIN